MGGKCAGAGRRAHSSVSFVRPSGSAHRRSSESPSSRARLIGDDRAGRAYHRSTLGGIWKWAWAAGPSIEQPGAAEAALLEQASLPKFSGFAQGNEPGPIRQRLPSLHVPSHCPGTISHCPSRTARRRPSAVHFFCFGGLGCGRARAASSRAAFRLFAFFSSRSSSLRRARNALGLPALTRFFRFSR